MKLTCLLWLIAILLTIHVAFATAFDWFLVWRTKMLSPNEPPPPPTVMIVRVSVRRITTDHWKVFVHSNNGCRWEWSKHGYFKAAEQEAIWVEHVLIAGCPRPPQTRYAT